MRCKRLYLFAVVIVGVILLLNWLSGYNVQRNLEFWLRDDIEDKRSDLRVNVNTTELQWLESEAFNSTNGAISSSV